ncbi:MAG: hypothetical protein ACLFTK_08455, partial [Anaerolineales bacterium]
PEPTEPPTQEPTEEPTPEPTEPPTEEPPAPNQPPVVQPIPDQTLVTGETAIVPVQASDPEGTQVFIAELQSGSTAIVAAEPDGDGNIRLEGISRGQVDVVATFADGEGARTTARFRVVVQDPTPVPNDPPAIETIPAQEVPVGEQISVPVQASDPEGTRPFLTDVESGSTEIVTAEPDGEGAILLTGVSEGRTTITLTVSDGAGLTTSTQFDALVLPPPPDEPPSIENIPDQTLRADEQTTVSLTVSDPEGEAVSILSAEADNPDLVEIQPGELSLTLIGRAAGQTTVSVSVADPAGQTAETSFGVTVEPPPPNEPPVVQPIPAQSVEIDQTIIVPVQASDPEGRQPFFEDVSSSATEIVVAESDGEGNVRLAGVSPGTATVSVVIADGAGGTTTTRFEVTVPALPTPTPNAPPVVQPIPNQTVQLNETIIVPLEASDPEGFRPFFDSATSNATEIARVEIDGEGNLLVTGVSPGTTTIDVVVTDGQGGTTSEVFEVRVEDLPTPTPDAPPVIQPIPEQQVEVDQTINVPVQASDPEGTRPFFESVTSSASQIVTAEADDEGSVRLTGISPGTATVTIVVADGTGATASTEFSVTVSEAPEPNAAPTIEPIANQQMTVDTFLPVAVQANDPNDDPLTVNATSSAESVAAVQVDDAGAVVVFGASPGTANITVTVTDPAAASASAVFAVEVVPAEEPPAEELPAGPDLASIPVIPPLDGDTLNNIQAIAANSEALATSVIVVGDTPPGAFLADAATAGYDLSAAPGLEATLTAYLNQPVGGGEASVLAEGGARATDPGWTVADLLNAANNAGDCAQAPNPVACSAIFQQPSVAVVAVGRNDALNGTPPEAFAADYQAVLDELVARGAIPVLTTLPGDPSVVGPYNASIVALAEANALPLWNLARAIPEGQVNTDLTLTSPGAGQNAQLTQANVESFGTARRNLSLLRLLDALRSAVPLG